MEPAASLDLRTSSMGALSPEHVLPFVSRTGEDQIDSELLPSSGVQAPGSRARGRAVEPEKAIENGRSAHVHDGPEALGIVELKVRDRHLSRENERDRSSKEAEEHQEAAKGLEDAADPGLR